MASTVYTYQLTGGTAFPVNFEYLARRFVVITLIGATRQELSLTTDYRFTGKMEITTNVAWGPANGFTAIEVKRRTSSTDRLVNFTDGSILRSQDLNVSQIQAIHIAEEARDVSDSSLVNNNVYWDALGFPIKNLGYPTAPTDATSVQYVQDQMARTVRAPSPETMDVLPPASVRAGKVLGFDRTGSPTVLIPSSGSASEILIDLKTVGVEGKGGDMVAAQRTALYQAVKTAAHAYNTTSVSIWETAHLAIGYTKGGDMNLWDWAPAINAASELALATKAGVVTFTAHRFRVKSTVYRRDGITFEGRGDLKTDTSGSPTHDTTTIANETNAEVVMASYGTITGPKNIIAHMRNMKVIGNTQTSVVLDLKGFWMSKFIGVFIGGGKTTVWIHSDIPNGYNCYYNAFWDSIVSGLNPNNHNNTPNEYGIRLTDLAAEIFFDNVQVINASNAFSVESGSYCHCGYLNIEYSSVNHQPIFIDAPNSVIADLRCDPHRPMVRAFLRMGPNSRNNRIHFKTFEANRTSELMKYYFSDDEGGRYNDIMAGQYFTSYIASRNLIPNPQFITTGLSMYGWSKSNVEITPSEYFRGNPATKITLTSALTLASAITILNVPVGSISIGDLIMVEMSIKVDSPSALFGISDETGFLKADGSINGNVITVQNTGGKFVRIRRTFPITALPNGKITLSMYPSRATSGAHTPEIGHAIHVAGLNMDVIDQYSHGQQPVVTADGTQPMLSDLTFRKSGGGVILTTPNGLKTYLLSVSDTGTLVITQKTP